jgi:hypothetical protein
VTAASSQLPASSKSTRLLLEAGSWRLEAPSDSSIRTLRCVWSEKTTVCRIFSCQRIVEATSCRPCDLQPWSVSPSDASFSPELLIVTSPHGECKLKLTLSHEVPSLLRGYRQQTSRLELCAQPRQLAGQPRLAHATSSGERRLENTGLEPVTSWLQTRRSPS